MKLKDQQILFLLLRRIIFESDHSCIIFKAYFMMLKANKIPELIYTLNFIILIIEFLHIYSSQPENNKVQNVHKGEVFV